MIDLVIKLGLATFLGILIGIEREFHKKEAGMRTFALVSLGSCIFTIIGIYLHDNFINVDPARVIQSVAIGIGFIGSGIIIYDKARVDGLTTAASLWSSAAMGVGIGLGLYKLSIIASFIIILVLSVLKFIEDKLFPQDYED